MFSTTRPALTKTRYPNLPTALAPALTVVRPIPARSFRSARMFSLTPHRFDQPKTFAHAKSLPKLPVPKLDASLERYVQSLKPLLLERAKEGGHDRIWVEKEMDRRREVASDFAKAGGIGQRLQARLQGE